MNMLLNIYIYHSSFPPAPPEKLNAKLLLRFYLHKCEYGM